MSDSLPDTHYDYVSANSYPQGYIIKYIDLYSFNMNSTVLSLGNNRFVDINSNCIFNSYDAWLETLPQRAKSDMGIKEYKPDLVVTNEMMRYALWFVSKI
jgi:hypothetical protein